MKSTFGAMIGCGLCAGLLIVSFVSLYRDKRYDARFKALEQYARPATITITNYVTLPSDFGPDGYGYRHLAKTDYELVQKCLSQTDDVWNRGTFLEDLTVTKTVTKEKMTANEIMEILEKQPNVANVMLAIGAKRSVFSLSTLAYPQYDYEYRLTKAQWKSLQDYCRLELIDPIATDTVVAHWKSITNGIPPFGLKVSE